MREAILRRFYGEDSVLVPLMPPEEARIATWLRGNGEATDSLTSWITARIEGRGLLPSSTPHDSAIKEGQDIEARQIARRLRELFAAPVNTGSEDEDNG